MLGNNPPVALIHSWQVRKTEYHTERGRKREGEGGRDKEGGREIERERGERERQLVIKRNPLYWE